MPKLKLFSTLLESEYPLERLKKVLSCKEPEASVFKSLDLKSALICPFSISIFSAKSWVDQVEKFWSKNGDNVETGYCPVLKGSPFFPVAKLINVALKINT